MCLFIGDMCIFEVVDILVFYYLVDCFVFFVKGYRFYLDEMFGLDFDGDKYFVMWYEKFFL